MNATELTIGDRIEAGKGDDQDRGTVLGIDGDQVTVGWDSGVKTTQSVASLNDVRKVGHVTVAQ